MFKVLIALDGSPISDEALGLATRLLTGREAAITVLHVIPRHLIYAKGGPIVAECYDPDEEHAASQSLLERAATRLKDADPGAVVTQELKVGDPADLILHTAEAHDADLIILGSRGLNAAQRFMLGSVSTKVSTHARCAVLVAHPKVLPATAAVLAEEGREVARA